MIRVSWRPIRDAINPPSRPGIALRDDAGLLKCDPSRIKTRGLHQAHAAELATSIYKTP
jgi:hypothetical protein